MRGDSLYIGLPLADDYEPYRGRIFDMKALFSAVLAPENPPGTEECNLATIQSIKLPFSQ